MHADIRLLMQSCSNEFEALVRGSSSPTCPECGSQDLDRKLSFPVVRSESTKAQLKAAVKGRDAAQAKDNPTNSGSTKRATTTEVVAARSCYISAASVRPAA